ncbi:unnamed protein product, partial [Meganyctiphanes norvegica]
QEKEIHHQKKPSKDYKGAHSRVHPQMLVPRPRPHGIGLHRPSKELLSESEVPAALLVLVDSGRKVVTETLVTLAPRMALLDALKEAKQSFSLKHGPYEPNPFGFKVQILEAERCVGLEEVGQLGTSRTHSLDIIVTRKHNQEVVWEGLCLPRTSDLLVHHGDVITILQRKL